MSRVSKRSPKRFSTSPTGGDKIPVKNHSKSSEKDRIYICPTCTRAFARLEHLKRHQRSHTNERPFQCAACGRCFARRDLVLRHQQKLHASLPTNDRSTAKKHPKGRKIKPKAGQIVSDYLNSNINIIKNNTSNKMPLPTKSQQISEGVYLINPDAQNSMDSSASSRRSSQGSKKPGSATNGSRINGKPYGASTGMSKVMKEKNPRQNNAELSRNAQAMVKNSALSFPTISLGLPIAAATATTPAMPLRDEYIDPQLSQQQQRQQLQQQLQQQQQQHQPPASLFGYHDHRHASFSAAASGSYTGIPGLLHPANNLESIEQEAPDEVNFTSPQVMHASDGHFNYMDLAELENFNLEDLNTPEAFLDLNNSGEPGALNKLNPSPSTESLSRTINPLQAENLEDSASYLKRPYKSLWNYKVEVPGTQRQNSTSNFDSSGGSSTGSSIPIQCTTTTTQTPQSTNSFSPFQQKSVDPSSILAQLQELTGSTSNESGDPQLSEQDEEWLAEFINAPIKAELPTISDHIGFGNSPSTDTSNNNGSSNNVNTGVTSTNENVQNGNSHHSLNQYFKSRQLDILKNAGTSSIKLHNNSSSRCTLKVRNYIMTTYHLNDKQFPKVSELNHYLDLYETEFNPYFPFIHIPSLNFESQPDQLPLMLAMAAVGTLYSFHARNSLTLFNLSRLLIHNYMASKLQVHALNHVPLYITQSLILHLFLSIFHNDVMVTHMSGSELSALVSLIKSTKLNLPIETFLLPPALSSNLSNLNDGTETSVRLLEVCHDYFLLAQSRIRMVHVLYYLSTLYSCFVGDSEELSSDDIKCGSPCPNEEIWNARNYNEWINALKKHNIIINSKADLIKLSNGSNSYSEMWHEMSNLSLNRNVGMMGLLSLLISLNSYIHTRSLAVVTSKGSDAAKVARWRMNERPYIESLIKTWETCFVRNGGMLVSKGQNIQLISHNPMLKLILPILSFTKIRKCIFLSPALNAVWTRDWDKLNTAVKRMTGDNEALRDSVTYSLDIINLWINIASVLRNAEKTSVRTPVFFLTCIFTAVLLISQYLYTLEVWARNYLKSPEGSGVVATADRVLWLRAESIFKKVEKNLLPAEANETSYAEFLRIQAKGALDVDRLDDEISKLALDPQNSAHIAEIISAGRLSARCLSLGVRTLADAPVWPVALVFAEALKSRATAIHEHLSTFTPTSGSKTNA